MILLGLAGCSTVGDGRHVCPVEECRAWDRFIAIETGEFAAVGFRPAPLPRPTGHLVVYIEGDGRAWVSRTRLSDDPTPRQPVALSLAAADPWGDVVYFGRPCQYLDRRRLDRCPPRFWSVARFNASVVEGMSAAIDAEKELRQASSISLVGFSGGGTVAALIAAQRDDVDSLVTVASPLDHDAWTRFHRVTALDQSENPARVDWYARPVCQVHFAGTRDATVPASLIGAYAARLPPVISRVIKVDGYKHRCCWADRWARRIAALRSPGSASVCPAVGLTAG